MDKFKYYDEMNDKEKENFINDLVKNFDEITTSDLQSIIQARFMNVKDIIKQLKLSDEVLEKVYKRVKREG